MKLKTEEDDGVYMKFYFSDISIPFPNIFPREVVVKGGCKSVKERVCLAKMTMEAMLFS